MCGNAVFLFLCSLPNSRTLRLTSFKLCSSLTTLERNVSVWRPVWWTGGCPEPPIQPTRPYIDLIWRSGSADAHIRAWTFYCQTDFKLTMFAAEDPKWMWVGSVDPPLKIYQEKTQFHLCSSLSSVSGCSQHRSRILGPCIGLIRSTSSQDARMWVDPFHWPASNSAGQSDRRLSRTCHLTLGPINIYSHGKI